MTEFISMKLKTDGKLKKLTRNLRNVDDKALGRTAQQIHRYLRKATPLGKTGHLRKKTTVQKVRRMHYKIGYTSDYAKFVNYGTGINKPGGQGIITRPGGGLMHWINKDGEDVFAYSTKGQRAQLMIEKVYAFSKPQVNRWYNTYLTKEINNILRGAGGPETTIAEAP